MVTSSSVVHCCYFQSETFFVGNFHNTFLDYASWCKRFPGQFHFDFLRSVPKVGSFFSHRTSDILSILLYVSLMKKNNLESKSTGAKIPGVMQCDFDIVKGYINKSQLLMSCHICCSYLHILYFWKTQLLFLFVGIFLTACLCIFR